MADRAPRPACAATLVLAAALTAQAAAPASGPPVVVGLERVTAGEVALPAGKTGLLAHAASVDADGRHAIDALRAAGVELVRLFSPEHGLRGEAAAGEPVPSGSDPRSGLPIVSLYGERTGPEREHLADLDVLVIDLQDAGVRFYTYASTLLHCLDAAAEAGLAVVVLDRPNPLGGNLVAGPVADRERVPPSLVNLAPGPLVHGLTLGELARLANHDRAKPAKLTVVPMRGWRRAMTWADTGRTWAPPSPNLRSADAALAYPGVALLEATNASEGRGTDRPFLLLGAPWLEPAGVERLRQIVVPGFRLVPSRFTPRPSAAAPTPKHANTECSGVEVVVTDAAAAEPYRLGLELLASLATQNGFAWRDAGAALTWLLGTPDPYAALARGDTVAAIVASDDAAHREWRTRRAAFLLYD